METSNIIALALGGVGFIISIIGLIATPLLNLKSKKLEKKLEYRFLLFQKITELWEHTNKIDIPESDKSLEIFMKEINKLIQLYGYDSEIKSFRKLVECYNYYAKNYTEDNKKILLEQFSNFFRISFNAYRKEIVLDKLPD